MTCGCRFLSLSVFLILILLCGMLPSCERSQMKHGRVLRVEFWMGSLKKTGELLDPKNLETVYEYYLLENLAVGLVRDDIEDPRRRFL